MKACLNCGKELSFWQRVRFDRCPACQAEADQKQAEADRLAAAQAEEQRQAAARQAERTRQARLELRKKCPVCGSTRYRVGRLPDAQGSALTGSNRARFRPEENWIDAYPLDALACLDCGHVRLFLFDQDRAYLDAENVGGS